MSKITPALWYLLKRPTAHLFVAGMAVRRMRRSVRKTISIVTCRTTLDVSFRIRCIPSLSTHTHFSQAVRVQHMRSPLRYTTTAEQPLDDAFPRKEVQV
jgi:hypothetical protein